MESADYHSGTSSSNSEGSHPGLVKMIDVSQKPATRRMARASATVRMLPETLGQIRQGAVPKGDVLAAARLAAIMAVKRTWEIVPLCHPIPVEAVEVDFAMPKENSLVIGVEVSSTAKTGVEMEALTGAAVAALCVYDMCKGIDREMTICEITLEWKVGGLSGHFQRQEQR